MDPRHPPVPYSATHAQSHSSGHSSPAETDYESEHNEKDKDTYIRNDSTRTDGVLGKSTAGRAHDSVISPFSPKASAPPSPCSSICSHVGRRHRSVSETQETHGRHSHGVPCPPRAHLDPEKADCHDSPRDHRSQNASVPDAAVVVYDKSEYHEKGPEDKAWQLLFYLSAPCALLSIAITFWTVVAILISLALYPLRLCSNRPPLSAQLTTFLAPALNLQLHLVYSFDASENYSVPMLLVIHLFSPIIAFGVAVAAWTAAGFWFFSSILGDPGGHDGGRHNDGKDCILGVRNYWERWLSRGLR